MAVILVFHNMLNIAVVKSPMVFDTELILVSITCNIGVKETLQLVHNTMCINKHRFVLFDYMKLY